MAAKKPATKPADTGPAGPTPEPEPRPDPVAPPPGPRTPWEW